MRPLRWQVREQAQAIERLRKRNRELEQRVKELEDRELDRLQLGAVASAGSALSDRREVVLLQQQRAQAVQEAADARVEKEQLQRAVKQVMEATRMYSSHSAPPLRLTPVRHALLHSTNDCWRLLEWRHAVPRASWPVKVRLTPHRQEEHTHVQPAALRLRQVAQGRTLCSMRTTGSRSASFAVGSASDRSLQAPWSALQELLQSGEATTKDDRKGGKGWLEGMSRLFTGKGEPVCVSCSKESEPYHSDTQLCSFHVQASSSNGANAPVAVERTGSAGTISSGDGMRIFPALPQVARRVKGSPSKVEPLAPRFSTHET